MSMMRTIIAAVCVLACLCLVGCAEIPPADTVQQFMDGSINATDQNGQTITADQYISEAIPAYDGEYALYDVTGDGVVELCVKTASSFDIFTIRDEALTLWHSHDPQYILLNNGALRYSHIDPLTGDLTGEYVVLAADGSVASATKYTASPVNGYTVNGKAMDKIAYDAATGSFLAIGNDKITWTTLAK